MEVDTKTIVVDPLKPKKDKFPSNTAAQKSICCSVANKEEKLAWKESESSPCAKGNVDEPLDSKGTKTWASLLFLFAPFLLIALLFHIYDIPTASLLRVNRKSTAMEVETIWETKFAIDLMVRCVKILIIFFLAIFWFWFLYCEFWRWLHFNRLLRPCLHPLKEMVWFVWCSILNVRPRMFKRCVISPASF